VAAHERGGVRGGGGVRLAQAWTWRPKRRESSGPAINFLVSNLAAPHGPDSQAETTSQGSGDLHSRLAEKPRLLVTSIWSRCDSRALRKDPP
jgi:hypothetical protein